MSDKKVRFLTSEEWKTEFPRSTTKKDNTSESLAWVALGVCFVILIFNPLVGAILGAGAFLWLLSAKK
jgi:hypothetical protein